jgi:hypothetical protein
VLSYWLLVKWYVSSKIAPIVNEGYQVTDKGAWCWFADPRALHYKVKMADRPNHIGYIDIMEI